MNLFIQDLPRLSVDIDLVYLPLVSRAQALSEISQALELLFDEIESALPEPSPNMQSDYTDCMPIKSKSASTTMWIKAPLFLVICLNVELRDTKFLDIAFHRRKHCCYDSALQISMIEAAAEYGRNSNNLLR